MTITHCMSGLRSIRQYRGLTLAEAAELIGVTPNSYARIEAGTRRTYFDKACMLADALGCSVDDLRTYRDADALFHHLAAWKRPLSGQVPPPPPPPAAAPSTGDEAVDAVLAEWGEPS